MTKAEPLIKLQQDAEGFIRMKRHFPASTPITITFSDGSSEEFTGRQLNAAYDDAPRRVPGAEPPGREGFLAGAQEKGRLRQHDRVRAASTRAWQLAGRVGRACQYLYQQDSRAAAGRG